MKNAAAIADHAELLRIAANYAKGGKAYVKQAGQPDREADTALTANGRDLERHDKALQVARQQRENTK